MKEREREREVGGAEEGNACTTQVHVYVEGMSERRVCESVFGCVCVCVCVCIKCVCVSVFGCVCVESQRER